MAHGRSLGDVRRVVGSPRGGVVVASSRSFATCRRAVWISCGNLSHPRARAASARPAGAAAPPGPGLVCGRRTAHRTAGHHRRAVQSLHRDVRNLRVAGGRHRLAAVGRAGDGGLGDRVRVARRRSRAGGVGRAPPPQRLSGAPLHHVVRRRGDCRARGALRDARACGACATAAGARRRA